MSDPAANLQSILSCQSTKRQEWFIKDRLRRSELRRAEHDIKLHNTLDAWYCIYDDFGKDPDYVCNLVLTRYPDGRYVLTAMAIHNDPVDVDIQNEECSMELNQDQLVFVADIMSRHTVYNKHFKRIWRKV